MQTRSWEGTDGEKKYRTEIVADRVQFGPRASGSGHAGGGAQGGGHHDGDETGPVETQGAGIDYPKEDINPDDIPF
jgi:single-strand DNA-binding protein